MLKRIPKSDISIRPFKAYKEWTFISGAIEIDFLEAEKDSSNITFGSNLSFPKNSLYGQLKAQFYNGYEDNPFLRNGLKTNKYSNKEKVRERYLSGSAKVIAIPQTYIGEGIKRGSLTLIDDGTTYFDDSYGNIVGDVPDRIYFGKVDVENGTINFLDIAENEYSGTIQSYFLDIENNEFTMSYSGTEYGMTIEAFDIETGVMLVDDIPFLQDEAKVIRFGNVFYNQGLIVLTREIDALFNAEWQFSYKSTKTIYEHEYLLIVDQDEFNVSTNPSAIVNVGKETKIITTTDGKKVTTIANPGVNYIRKKSVLDNGNVLDYRFSGSVGTTKAGFEHWSLSGSMDSTGSYLAPFITTIGLYNDEMNMVAVAKLPQPIKSEHDLTVNFLVRFDT